MLRSAALCASIVMGLRIQSIRTDNQMTPSTRCVLYFTRATCSFCGTEMRLVPTERKVRKWGFIPITKRELAPEPGWTLETDRRYIDWLSKRKGLKPCVVRLCGACKDTAHAAWENEMKDTEG